MFRWHFSFSFIFIAWIFFLRARRIPGNCRIFIPQIYYLAVYITHPVLMLYSMAVPRVAI